VTASRHEDTCVPSRVPDREARGGKERKMNVTRCTKQGPRLACTPGARPVCLRPDRRGDSCALLRVER